MNPLLIGLAASIVLGLVGTGIQTVRLAHRDTELADEKLAFADFKKDTAIASLKVVQQAALKSDAALGVLGTKIDNLNAVAGQVRVETRIVKSNGGPCTADPAYLAWIDGVQRIAAARRASGGAGQTVKGPADKVPGAGAPVPK